MLLKKVKLDVVKNSLLLNVKNCNTNSAKISSDFFRLPLSRQIEIVSYLSKCLL
ncbi:hypothetical protein GCWU000324_03143 [Kingella oralis ATCC 51147]|uniref:Uncharacterized protein n=1 Tax=Kingella oralis ATCC 51147 TaxID=629741 RepID=C4GN54_9NEIS|nr:hypothetical protein GCWU000324_03143 [Kingella oralis ATCC 51147]